MCGLAIETVEQCTDIQTIAINILFWCLAAATVEAVASAAVGTRMMTNTSLLKTLSTYWEPIFQQKRAHAFRYLDLLGRNIDYPRGLCPKAEKIMSDEVFITDICKFPNTSKEINEFALAVKKIISNLSKLKSIKDE